MISALLQPTTTFAVLLAVLAHQQQAQRPTVPTQKPVRPAAQQAASLTPTGGVLGGASRGNDTLAPDCGRIIDTPARIDGFALDDRVGDSGIVSVVLDPASVNLVLHVESFTGPVDRVDWSLGRLNSTVQGTGSVIVTDDAGNVAICAADMATSPDCDNNGTPDADEIAGDASLDWNQNGILDVCEQLGPVLCSPQPHNSDGFPAFIIATGSNRITDNDVTLSAHNVKRNSFGFFAASQTSGNVPASFGTSSGNLCLGLPYGGYRGSVVFTGNSGEMSLALDLPTGVPVPNASGSTLFLSPGMTLVFQGWYRDSGAILAPNNLTDAVVIYFQ